MRHQARGVRGRDLSNKLGKKGDARSENGREMPPQGLSRCSPLCAGLGACTTRPSSRTSKARGLQLALGPPVRFVYTPAQ